MNSRMKVTQHRTARSSRSSGASSASLLSVQPPVAATVQPAVQARFGHSFARLVADSASRLPRETVQRKGVGEDEELQMKADPTVQREGIGEDEELQMKAEPAVQRKETSGGSANNTGLPDNVKTGIESRSGMSLDDVKVHYNSSQPSQLQALAYTQGTDIHVAPGQEQHVPHEAWHVVQQKQGRVQPTMELNGAAINDDTKLEHEADIMGRAAV
jgi:hypothetical protein